MPPKVLAFFRLPLCTVLLITLIVALFSVGRVGAQPADLPGFRVVGRHLYDHLGHQVVLVGVNKMVIWTDRDGMPAFPEIAKTGANAVRIVWLTEGAPDELDTAITNAVAHQLIPIVDCHDSTGEWSELQNCVDYWVRPDVVAVLRKHETYLLINIANEAGAGVVPSQEFRAAYELAIRRMRAAGLHVPLIIDAQGWGQNIDDLQLNGPYLIAADPDHNLMFSIHMWWPSARRGTRVEQMVIDEIAESVAMELPLIIGEFAHKAAGCSCCIPYETIIREAAENDIGYLAWSWGPGNRDCEEMDMTEDGTFETLHGWGREVALISPYSIQNIAVRPDWLADIATPVPTPTPVPAPAADVVLSLHQPVTASSIENDELAPENAVDGDITTRWSSAWTADETLTVDLEEPRRIERIVLSWEAAYAAEYKLQVSDNGQTWSDIVHVTDGDGGWDDHLVSTDARYVRMQGLRRATEYGYSLWEWWILSDADVDLAQVAAEEDAGTGPDLRPDLVVTDIRWTPAAPRGGDTVIFEATIANHGNSASHMDPPIPVAFEIGGETVARGYLAKPLAPGAEMVVTADHADQAGAWRPNNPQEFIVLAQVDGRGPAPYGVVAESDENNNMLTAYGAVQPAATPTPGLEEEEIPPAPTHSPTATPAATTGTGIAYGRYLVPIALVVIIGLLGIWWAVRRNRARPSE